jgi:hypothetical protein
MTADTPRPAQFAALDRNIFHRNFFRIGTEPLGTYGPRHIGVCRRSLIQRPLHRGNNMAVLRE